MNNNAIIESIFHYKIEKCLLLYYYYYWFQSLHKWSRQATSGLQLSLPMDLIPTFRLCCKSLSNLKGKSNGTKPKKILSTRRILQGLTLSWFPLKIPNPRTELRPRWDAEHVELSRTLTLLKWSSPWLLKWSSPQLFKWSSSPHLIRTSTQARELNLQLDSNS